MLKTKPRKTVEDYLALPDDVRAELIDGEFFMMASPFRRHQDIVAALMVALKLHVDGRAIGSVHVSPLDVHLPTGDIVQPDVIFVSAANAGILQDWIRGVPDLLVEVLSTTHTERDRLVKRDLYARNGVKEYWIVDEDAGAVEIFRLIDGRYGDPVLAERADVLTSPLLPGLALSVAAVIPPAGG